MVGHHGHTSLVVLTQLGRQRLWEAQFHQEISKSEDVFDGFGRSDEFRFRGAEAYGSRGLCQPANETVSHVQRVTIVRALLQLVGEVGVGKT